jgi:hypothetical protein
MLEILKMVCLICWSFAGAAFTVGILYSMIWMKQLTKMYSGFFNKENEF